ncbi:prolipoprotein diacylglyceryl transferase, partial [Arthrospira platensis SPKY1]|nr:prolipoprotein diacylglyceryl transferase [Arthrospira platensis SPKY1]
IYSSINAALLCLLLWSYYPFRRRDGEIFAAMLVLYPLTRILLEAIRVDEGGKFGTILSISQIVSLGVIAAALVLWSYILRQPKGSVLPPQNGAVPGLAN